MFAIVQGTCSWLAAVVLREVTAAGDATLGPAGKNLGEAGPPIVGGEVCFHD